METIEQGKQYIEEFKFDVFLVYAPEDAKFARKIIKGQKINFI